MKKIILLALPLLLCVSTAQAKVTFDPLVINTDEDVIFSWRSDWPVDFSYLTGVTLANGEILPCPDAWEYPPYTSSGGEFAYEIKNKPTAWEYGCMISAIEYPFVNTGTVSHKYQWKVKPAFESLFDPAPATVETGKNIRLTLRTSDPVQPLPSTIKPQQIQLFDSYGQEIEINDTYNPIINIAYFSTPSDPRVVYDLKFPSTYTWTITIQPHETNIVRQDGATVLNPVPYVAFDLIDPAVVLDWSGNVIPQETPILDQYLTGAMLDPNITSGSPQTLGGAILDIRSMMYYFMIALGVFIFFSFLVSITRR